MANFSPPFEKRTTEELIYIVFSEPGDWEPEAVELAQSELIRRGIGEKQQKILFEEFEASYAEQYFEELDRRKTEDFDIVGKIFMVAFWPKYLFDWSYKSEGYLLKHKNKVRLILWGVLAYALLFGMIIIDGQREREELKEKMEHQADSLRKIESAN